MVTKLCRLFIICVLASAALQVNASQPVTTETLEGAWELVSYDTADGQPEVNGLQLMQDGHFSIAYEQTFPAGELSARSHAGTYRADGNQITYNVRWWVQHVVGEDAIISSTSVSPEFDYDGINLKLRFSNGNSQHWRRVEPQTK